MAGDKLTKAEIVANIHTAAGLSKKEIHSIVELFYAAVTQALIEGRTVELRRFGTFETKQRRGRTGRNPKTGQLVEVQTHGVAVFRPGRDLKSDVWELRE